MRTIEEAEAYLRRAVDTDVRGRLVARGMARAMMRRNGTLADDAPSFSQTLDTDLAEFGFAVLDAALELKALNGSLELIRDGLSLSGQVFESLVKNGQHDRSYRGFYRVISAASYHLAGYAAVAFAVFSPIDLEDQNLNPLERVLVKLVLRDMDAVRTQTRSWLETPDNRQAGILSRLEEEHNDQSEILCDAVITGAMRSLAYYEFALQTGRNDMFERSAALVDAAYGLAGELGHAPLWWITRLMRNLLRDLWDQSLHQVLPNAPSTGDSANFAQKREIFIASLYHRSVSQIELWPSQIDAARRAADPNDDLVVALPTSAGKTRIAELATLTALSLGKRVLIVTPLRALSAQTERSFRDAFAPLGATVSSLYGKSGLSAGDANALATDEIVVATPEKLDFALRSDPSIIDDVGLIVLDEGHLIGPTDREIRYEILVQKLLKRADSHERRIVCLSAILPQGPALEDMTGWIRSNAVGEPVRADWRPTKQRFGSLEWYGDHGKLMYDLDADAAFVSRFVTSLPPLGREAKPHPRDVKGITVFAAWKFANEGKKTLVFVTQANWVEGFATEALKLVERGYIPALLDDPQAVAHAVAIGKEWLGEKHPAVKVLEIGIAVHHGKLPSSFLREVERLLATGVIKVTVASPTLAQGLNLNAATLLVPYLYRSGELIKPEEFANVAGRAGRAFVDTEGLIIHVMADKHPMRRQTWADLVNDTRYRVLTSGLMLVIGEVALRLRRRGIALTEDGLEFLANGREDWLTEPDDLEDGDEPIVDLLARLDAIVLGLIEALDADSDDLPLLLDEALEGSFWSRQIKRKTKQFYESQKLVLTARARAIWVSTTTQQRRGHYTMGVGLEAGLAIDQLAEPIDRSVDSADLAALNGDLAILQRDIIAIADQLLAIKPFQPNADLEQGWQDTLKAWLAGAPIAEIGDTHVPLIEDAFIYRMVWALEALRVRRMALGWEPAAGTFPGAAASCLETGLPSYRMSMLVRAGLASRTAAKKVVETLDPDFLQPADMRRWLKSRTVIQSNMDLNWPTTETHEIWLRFCEEIGRENRSLWRIRERTLKVPERFRSRLRDKVFRMVPRSDGAWDFLSADYNYLGRLTPTSPLPSGGITYGEWDIDAGRIKSIAPSRPI